MSQFRRKAKGFFTILSKFILFAGQAFKHIPYNIRHPKEMLKHIWTIGVQSIPIVGLTGLFTGMILGLQVGQALDYVIAGTSQFVGGALGVAVIRELGPVLTSLIVVSRVCSSITAQIGTMRVTEQIDALSTLSVNPMRYLVSSRLLAGIISLPVLCYISSIISISGGWIMNVIAHGTTSYTYWYWVRFPLRMVYVVEAGVKMIVIGTALMLISTFFGFNTKGGADGVGKATITSVVTSSFMVILLDYMLGIMFIIFKL